MTFDSVIGQKGLTTTLKNAIQENKLAHAYLFCGPRGVGKTTCARIFAKTINCEHLSPDGEACDQCESCRAFNEGRSYSISELDAASNNSVDDIRNLIEQVRIPPQVGQYKVFIIDEVHMLSTQAFNAFLKTLEEPPSYAKFILATTERHKVLPTILSRCQVYDFYRIGIEDIIDHLRSVAANEGVQYEEDALAIIAQKADGGMRDALSIFDQMVSYTQGNITYKGVIDSLNILDYDYFFRFTDLFLEHNVPQCMLLFNEILQCGFDGGNFIGGLASHFRDLLVSSEESTLPLLDVGEEMRARYQAQSARCTAKFIYRSIRLCNNCDLSYKTSRNKRLLVELTLIQLAQCSSEGDDDDGVGRRPRKLNPIFGTLTIPTGRPNNSTSSDPRTVSAPSAASPASGVQPLPVAPSSTKYTANPAAVPPAQPKAAIPSTTPPAQTPSTQAPSSIRSRIRTISIHAPKTAEETTATPVVSNGFSTEVTATTRPSNRLTQEKLIQGWNSFAASLPHDEIATRERMMTIRPQAGTDGVAFSITVTNTFTKQDFENLRPRIVQYLRATLSNPGIKMEIALEETRDTNRYLSQREQYTELCTHHPLLEEFTKQFDLDLS